jgi:hypothetical protein
MSVISVVSDRLVLAHTVMGNYKGRNCRTDGGSRSLRNVWGVLLKCDGRRWRTGGEVNRPRVDGVGRLLFTLPRNMVYPALLPPMRTPRLPVVDWTDALADLNGFVRFAERRNLVSARVTSHFKRSLSLYHAIRRHIKQDLYYNSIIMVL